MVGDPAAAPEQAAWRAAGGRPASFERHLLAVADGRALGRYPGPLRPSHHLCEPLQPLAQSRCMKRLLDAVSEAYDGDIQMIESSSIRVHQPAANAQKKPTDPVAWIARVAAGCRPARRRSALG